LFTLDLNGPFVCFLGPSISDDVIDCATQPFAWRLSAFPKGRQHRPTSGTDCHPPGDLRAASVQKTDNGTRHLINERHITVRTRDVVSGDAAIAIIRGDIVSNKM